MKVYSFFTRPEKKKEEEEEYQECIQPLTLSMNSQKMGIFSPLRVNRRSFFPLVTTYSVHLP